MLRAIARRGAGAVVAAGFFLLAFRKHYGPDGLHFEDANMPWTRDLLNAAMAQFPHAWNPHFGGGYSSIMMNASIAAPIAAQAAVSFLGVPLSTVLVYPAIMTAAFLAAFALLRECGTAFGGAVLLALFYVGNPWFLDRVTFGHAAILIAVALVPCMFWAMRREARSPHAYGLLLVAVAALILLADVRIAYLAFIALYAIAFIRLGAALVSGGTDGLRQAVLSPATLYPLAAPFGALVLNAWWTFPFALYANINQIHGWYPPLEEIADFSSKGDPLHAMALSGTWIRYAWTTMASFGPALFWFWYSMFAVLAAAALFGPGISATRRAAVIAAIAGGLALSTGTSVFPAESLYWFYEHVPFAAFFRDPNKFSYLVVLGLVAGVGSAWGRLKNGVRAGLGAAVLVICVPLFTGEFHVPLGGGLQAFSERPHFVKLLDFLQRQPGAGTFRVAVIPPWLAEQSLRPGEWYVSNPLVFQLEIPTIDAKLVSTGTATNQSAWRAFDALYWGIDAHPALTFSRLAIRYFVVLDQAQVSLGAGQSPFYGAHTKRISAALLADPQIREVYRDGAYHILENTAYLPPVRTAQLPLIAGSVSDDVREALPAAVLGDRVAAPDGTMQTLPRGTIPFGESGLDRCLAAGRGVTEFSAYPHVDQRADWPHYWSASDYTQLGTGEKPLDRALQRFALPFAITRSTRPIEIPVAANGNERVFVQAGGFTGETIVSASLDGKPPVLWRPSSLGFTWHEAGRIGPGKHVVSVTGSTIGTVLKSVALVPAACTADGISIGRGAVAGGRAFYVPGYTAWATLTSEAGRWTLRNAGVSVSIDGRTVRLGAAASGGALPAHVAAFTLDGVPVPRDRPFATLTGSHLLAGYGAKGPYRTAPLRGAGSIATADLVAPPGSRIVVRIKNAHALPVKAVIAEGDRTIEIVVPARSIASTIVGPLATGAARVSVPRPAGRSPYEVSASAAVERLRAQARVPAGAVPIPGGARASLLAIPAAPVKLQFAHDRVSLFTIGQAAVPWVDPQAGALNQLRLYGVRTPAVEREVISMYYRTASGEIVTLPVAEFEAGPVPRDVAVTIPSIPHMTSFAAAIRRPDRTNAPLWAASAEFAGGSAAGEGYFVRIPATVAARAAQPVLLAESSFERFTVAQPFAGPLVGGFSYDGYWRYGNAAHLVANGAGNLWITGEPGKGEYTLQGAYEKLLVLTAALWLVLGSAMATIALRERRLSGHGAALRSPQVA